MGITSDQSLLALGGCVGRPIVAHANTRGRRKKLTGNAETESIGVFLEEALE